MSTKPPFAALLEPDAAAWADEATRRSQEHPDGWPAGAKLIAVTSIAFSLKRIADYLQPVNVKAEFRPPARHPEQFAYDAGKVTTTPPIDVAVSKYVCDRLGALALNDFDMMDDRSQNLLIQAAIDAVREWDRANAVGSGDVFSNVGKVTAAPTWFGAKDLPALHRYSLRDPIEVSYVIEPGYGIPVRPNERMPLGDAIEWSTFKIGTLSAYRKLKASIAQWRPL